MICLLLAACGGRSAPEPAPEAPASSAPVSAEPAAAEPDVIYGLIRSDLSGLTPEIAGAYLAVVDALSADLGYDEAEAGEGECLRGGFIRDWDADGTPELCLLLKTSPRDQGGTPLYGWYPPTLCLYTYRNGQAIQAGECDLYFATAGREAAVAAVMTDGGMRYILWDRSDIVNETYLYCHALIDGVVETADVPADVAAASEGAETAQAFLDALDGAQLLLYNSSGEARIEGPANARELRAALAAKAA